VAASRERVSAAQTDAERIDSELTTFPEELKNTDYGAVKEVVERADRAGRSRSNADTAEEARVVRRFAREEKDKLAQQTGGSVRYVLSDKGVASDVADSASSAAARGQEKAIEKQLEERQRRASPAHRYIDDNEERLGKNNLETLRKRADEITRASYAVHVELPEEKAHLEQLVREAGDVKKTLARVVEEERAVLDEPKTTPRRKKLAQDRIADAEKSAARVDEEKQNAEAALKDLEQRTEELAGAHARAIESLKDKLEQLARAAPQGADAT
jgi:hypothetical protein